MATPTREQLESELEIAQRRNATLKSEIAELEPRLEELQAEYDAINYDEELEQIEQELNGILGGN